MRCPKCGKGRVKVILTRQNADKTFRKRECRKCGYIFYTEEVKSASAKYGLSKGGGR